MEKMHAAASTSQTAATSANAKNRAAQGQGGGVAGDFSGLLASLGNHWLSDSGDSALDGALPSAQAPDPANLNAENPSTLMSSLLNLQVGFAGGSPTASPLSTTSQSMATVQLDATQPKGANALTAMTGLPLAVGPNNLGDSLAVGSRSVAVASSGGELGLVAQTAALDTAMESESAQTAAAGKKILGRHLTSSTLSTTEAWAARTTAASPRPEAPERTAAAHASTLVQTVVSNSQPSLGDRLTSGSLPVSFNDLTAFATAAPHAEALGELLTAQGQQSGGRSGEGRGASTGQNQDTQGLYSMGAAGAEPTTPGENPMFDMGAALPTEDSVAEQVAYWVNQNIQNAELTVEHDGHPVQVTVSLNGNEAHVSFASDQNETRALLDAGVAQLRDLLESQGLVLSGMSVGEASTQSQSNQPNGQRGSAPTDARQTTVESNTPTRHARRADVISDQAVDVFV